MSGTWVDLVQLVVRLCNNCYFFFLSFHYLRSCGTVLFFCTAVITLLASSHFLILQLTDFGLSKVGLIHSTDDLSAPSLGSGGFLVHDELKDQPPLTREQRQKHSVAGTPDYLAPEILLGMGHG